MISREEAELLANQYIDSLGADVPGGVVLLLESTLERPYGWVFFFNSKRFLDTRDPLDGLGGNSPFLVEALNGTITLLGTATPVAESLRRLEAERGLTTVSSDTDS
jgi:hypothetical protein